MTCYQVPLSLFGVTGNYASALFLAAAKANELDRVESEILDVIEASKRSSLFSQFIRDLSVPRETRVKAVTELFSQAGFSDITKNFLGMILNFAPWIQPYELFGINLLPFKTSWSSQRFETCS